jgi:cytochrome c-type biogenesis protein CcmH
MIRLAIVVLLVLTAPAFAIDQGKAFDDPELQARYEDIIGQVRCLKCQNQSIKDSNVFLAADLRREIRRLLSEGKSDQEIFDFLVERYGEFALYSPRKSGKTLVLWVAPFLLLTAGVAVGANVIRKRMSLPLEDETQAE